MGIVDGIKGIVSDDSAPFSCERCGEEYETERRFCNQCGGRVSRV